MLSPLERTLRAAAVWLDGPGAERSGNTPHRIVFRQGGAALRRFTPAEPRHRPVLVCLPMPWSWTLWDLSPGRSLVARLLEAGVPLYLLDWGQAGPEDDVRPLEHYVDDVLGRMLDRAERDAGGPLDAIGYSFGGTLLAIHLARHPHRVERVVFVATPADAHASPWLRRLSGLLVPSGHRPDRILQWAHDMVSPLRPLASLRTLWQRTGDPGLLEEWAVLRAWRDAPAQLPAEATAAFIQHALNHNALITGGWVLGDRPVALHEGRAEALILAARDDTLAPPEACLPLQELWGGPTQATLIDGGHVSVVLGDQLPEQIVRWAQRQEVSHPR